jgi:hypothetical protein
MPASRPAAAGLTHAMHACIHACMATKTISIDLAAYETLRKARLRPDESFSRVIKRARWDESPSTGVLTRLEKAQLRDEPPEDAWSE